MNRQKIKGTRFENTAVKLLNEMIEGAEFKRVVGSGAIGTIANEPLLMGDIYGEIDRFPLKLRGECKTGYSNGITKEAKSFTLRKEWLDKIKMECSRTFSFPFLMGHFDNARTGVTSFVVLDVDDFAMLLNSYTDLQRELEKNDKAN